MAEVDLDSRDRTRNINQYRTVRRVVFLVDKCAHETVIARNFVGVGPANPRPLSHREGDQGIVRVISTDLNRFQIFFKIIDAKLHIPGIIGKIERQYTVVAIESKCTIRIHRSGTGINATCINGCCFVLASVSCDAEIDGGISDVLRPHDNFVEIIDLSAIVRIRDRAPLERHPVGRYRHSRIITRKDVSAVAPCQRVVTDSANESVSANPTRQLVIAKTTVNYIIAGATVDNVR